MSLGSIADPIIRTASAVRSRGHHEDHSSSHLPVARCHVGGGADQHVQFHDVGIVRVDQRGQQPGHHTEFKQQRDQHVAQRAAGRWPELLRLVLVGQLHGVGGRGRFGGGLRDERCDSDRRPEMQPTPQLRAHDAGGRVNQGRRSLTTSGDRGHRHPVPDRRSHKSGAGGAGALHQSSADDGGPPVRQRRRGAGRTADADPDGTHGACPAPGADHAGLSGIVGGQRGIHRAAAAQPSTGTATICRPVLSGLWRPAHGRQSGCGRRRDRDGRRRRRGCRRRRQ